MSLSIESAAPTSLVGKVKAEIASAVGGGSVPYSVGTTAAGGYIAQGSGAPASSGGGAKSLILKMGIGAVIGAGLGFGASFISLPIIGQVAAPIAAAVGGAIGAIGGLVVHLIGKRKQNLAMQAQTAAMQQEAMAPTPSPGRASGGTLKLGSRGAAAKKLQTELKKLGLYAGPINATFDKATAAAVRKYEVMKGVMPTGLGSPDLRAAVTQDAQLVAQYA